MNEDMKAKIKKQVSTMGLRRHRDNSIILPIAIPIRPCANFLTKKADEEERYVALSRETNAHPPAGAVALYRALEEVAGLVTQVATPTFFGENPPEMIQVPIGPHQKVSVPWGRMEIAILEGGHIETSTYKLSDGRICFKAVAEVKGKDKAFVNKIFDAMDEELRTNSIYQGKAIRAKFDFDPMQPGQGLPDFLPASFTFEDLIYNPPLHNRLKVSVFGRLAHRKVLKRRGVRFKRGILAYSKPGLGKTAFGSALADHCQKHSVTFLLCEDPHQFVEARRMASELQPAVVYVEDFDKALERGRSKFVNAVLESIDGIESKKEDVMVVFTTNHPEKFPPVLTRDGRLDDLIEFTAPTAETACRLVEMFGGEHIDRENMDWGRIGEALAGLAPPTIENIVGDSKSASVILSDGGPATITTDGLLTTADAHKNNRLPQNEAVPADVVEEMGNAALHVLASRSTHDEVIAQAKGASASARPAQ